MEFFITLCIVGIGYMYYMRYKPKLLGSGQADPSEIKRSLDEVKNELREVRLELAAIREKLGK